MILVTLGTQKQPFTRLLDMVEKISTKEKIIVQAGNTKYESKKMEIFDFVDYETMDKLIDEANIIITHGGTGSIVTPLKKGKKVIACPRLKKYHEHVDDHQEQIVNIFAEVGYILKVDDNIDLNYLIKEIKNKKMTKFISNTSNFLHKLKEEIDR